MTSSYFIIYGFVSLVGLYIFTGVIDSLKPPVKRAVNLVLNVFVVSYLAYLGYKILGGPISNLGCEVVRNGVCLVP